MQSNSVAQAVQTSFGVSPVYTGVVLTVLTAIVVLGGIRNIATASSFIVPVMAVLYVLGGLGIIVLNLHLLVPAVQCILQDAFTGQAVVGGAVGTVIRYGVARGVFSNEAGMGSAPIAAAAAKTDHPVRQALVSMTGTFLDTIIVCSITGIVLVMGLLGANGEFVKPEQLTSAALTTTTFERMLPGPGGWIVTIGLIFFAYSTILGWCYYGERNVERLVGVKWVLPYRIIFSLVVFVGATTSLSVVWNVADILNGLMAIPNLIGLLVLSGLIARETKHYLDNDPELRASKQEIDTFMEGRPGAIDTYETTGV